MTELQPKQEAFCLEYIVDRNATRAYMAAYPDSAEASAATAGSRMLRNVKVQSRITELFGEIAERQKLKAEDVIAELRKLAFWNIKTFLKGENLVQDLTELSDEQTIPVAGIKVKEEFRTAGEATVRTVTTELKLADKRSALVDLGRHLGIFKEDNEQGSAKIVVKRK